MTTQLKPPVRDSLPETSNVLVPTPPSHASPWRLLVRPLFLASVLMHGALLAVPVPPETQAKKPDIKDVPVTKTVSLKRPVAQPKPRPKPRPQRQPSPQRQARPARLQRQQAQPRPVPQPLRPALQPPPAPQPPAREAEKPQDVKSQDLALKDANKGGLDSKQETQNSQNQSLNAKNTGTGDENTIPIENEEVEALFQELDQSLISASESGDYTPEPKDFPEAEKLFTSDSIQAYDVKSNPTLVANGGIVNSPRYYRLKSPDEVVDSLPEISAFKTAGPPIPKGNYAGGPVYELKAGGKTYYINLIKAKGLSKATFVVFWRWDPNNPPQQ
ncbi:MAG: hypothetical protein ACFCU8_12205 [Thermosynechococcaceae cyanobacterium]